MPNDDTIAAIATAPGRAAVGIVRISGPLTRPISEQLVGKQLEARVVTLVSFKDQQSREIDRGLAVFFPQPNSYTAEDMLELQAHGNPVLLACLLGRCVELGARLAEPGEFTRRAFLNGKLDLAQAEAVADIIAAQSQAAVRAASRALSGYFSIEIQQLTRDLVETRVLVEAALDFPEEELDVLTEYSIREHISELLQTLSQILSRATQGKLLAEGVSVALVGAPNAGKSSVLNRLAQQDLAIVTEQAGTTRDTIQARVELQGVPFQFIDTAGIRESSDLVEQLGIARSQSAGEAADILVVVVDVASSESGMNAELLKRFPNQRNVVVALNKVDLVQDQTKLEAKIMGPYPSVLISAKTGTGFEELGHTLLRVSGWDANEQTETVFVAHSRQLAAMREAEQRLAACIAIDPRNPELIAEELRYATGALGKITGEVTSDDVLGEIFAKFCIGK